MRCALPLATALVLAGCSTPSDLNVSRAALASHESHLVRKKADEALAARDWTLAWNLEAQAGLDRGRLEAIALAALEDEAIATPAMLQNLRKKYGGLSDDARARMAASTQKAIDAKDWRRATEIQLVAADDAPDYKGAWDVYALTPAEDALPVLERIQKAREDHEAAAKAASGGG